MSDVFLQLENSPCLLFTNVPWTSRARIVVSYANGASAAIVKDAQELFAEIVNALDPPPKNWTVCSGNFLILSLVGRRREDDEEVPIYGAADRPDFETGR